MVHPGRSPVSKPFLIALGLVTVAACGGKVVVDAPSASAAGGAGGTSTTLTTADGAPNTSAFVAVSVTTGSGKPCDPTYTCVAAITPPDIDTSKLCEGSVSAALYDALIQCACVDVCAIQCGGNACLGEDGSPSCTACVSDPVMGCSAQFTACANDV